MVSMHTRMVMCDAGHITENLYLACTSIGLGGCAIGAVNGKVSDEAFGLDGEEKNLSCMQCLLEQYPKMMHSRKKTSMLL